MDKMIHKFEEAGLGIAPFTFEYAIWEDWSNCQYCGHDIRQKCYIKDVNGKIFYVGNECVNQTGDAGLISEAKEHIKELRKKMRHEREARTILRGRLLLREFPELLEAVANTSPNPKIYKQTLTDFVYDRMRYGGTKYKLDLTKKIEEIAKIVLSEHNLGYLADHFDTLAAGLEAFIEYEKAVEKEQREKEMERQRLEWQQKRDKIAVDNADIIKILESIHRSPFVNDMIVNLKTRSIDQLSPRQVEVLSDIYGKTFGNRNTDEYQKAYAEFYRRGLR